MSERLTARSPKNNMAYLVNVKDNEQVLEGSYNTLLCVRDAFEKLATYEETGLSPIAIPELLGALEITVDRLDDGSAWSDENLDQIKSIISRAKGEEETK